MNAPAQPRDELALLSSLFVAYPDALLLVDDKGRIARANPAAANCSATARTNFAA